MEVGAAETGREGRKWEIKTTKTNERERERERERRKRFIRSLGG
jgi:hypothetical protein